MGQVQPDAKKNLAQIGLPRRGVGVRSTEWYEGTAKTRVRVTATTCESCDGRGSVPANPKAKTTADLGLVPFFDGTRAVNRPKCPPCDGRGFVIERQRELPL